MQDTQKTKAQLVEELAGLRQRVAELEAESRDRNDAKEAALDALKESEKKFRALTESTTAQIMIAQEDRFLYANQATLDHYGRTWEELSQCSPHELFGKRKDEAQKAEGEAFVEEMARRGDAKIHHEFYETDEEGGRRWFEAHGAPLDVDGEQAWIWIQFDVTERKRAEEALKESERKFRRLAESTTAHISIMQDDRYVYANQAFLDYFELEREDLKLVKPEDLMMGMMTPEAIAEAAPVWQAALERGDSHIRFEFQDLEGTWFQTNVAMMELDGKPTFISMDFDVTELKRAQREMHRADKMAALGQIVAGVAHEINNPNNFIHFNLPILRRYIDAIAPLLELRLEEEPELEILGMPYEVFQKDIFKLLGNMEHGSKRITSIVSDLKTYVRSDEEQTWKAVGVGQAIERVMTLVGKQVRKMVKRFEVELEEGLPKVSMNVGKIEQVLINLLINAGDAADKEDAWVKVSARLAAGTEGWIELRVEDNGAGIPEDKLDQIFEPFYTSKGRDKGTGLGLSISHGIIEEHGGRISVESKLGEGTQFTVLLPAARTT